MIGRLKEELTVARGRLNPDGMMVSGAIAWASYVMVPVQTIMTAAIHEASREVPIDTLRLGAVGLLGIASAVGVFVESQTLHEKGYSASPISGMINILTGKPVVASALSHVFNFAHQSVLSPASVVAIGTALGGDEGRVAMANTASIALVWPAFWGASINTLISNDRIDPVTDKIQRVRESVERRVYRFRASLPGQHVDEEVENTNDQEKS